MFDVCESLIHEYQGMQDFNGFKMETIRALAIECPFKEDEFLKGSSKELVNTLYHST